ncbi:MAG: hypothetical protein IJY35_03470 [Clostridia bacterium]|nr:hypothetical protein [Clostridia bacterium]
MKLLSLFVAVLLVICSALSVSAGDGLKIIGEVLYHQDFSEESDLADSGIRVGTQSSENSMMTCVGDNLEIKTFDNGRVYAIFPEIAKETTYTVEFSFRFSEISAENGFISLILICRGDEPTNISSIVIRANGELDGFDSPCEKIMTAIKNGEMVNVQVPIRENVLNEVIMSAGDAVCTIERESVLVLSDGQMGLAVRNASVEVPEIYVVHGVDYTEKLGYFADYSYSEDGETIVTVTPAVSDEGIPETSPETGDTAVMLMAAAAATGLGLARRLSAR